MCSFKNIITVNTSKKPKSPFPKSLRNVAEWAKFDILSLEGMFRSTIKFRRRKNKKNVILLRAQFK